MTLNAKTLAKILFEEFDRDDWGDINPSYFEAIAQGIDPKGDDDNVEEQIALDQVLRRVVKRLEKITLTQELRRVTKRLENLK